MIHLRSMTAINVAVTLLRAEYRKVTEKPSYELKELKQVSIVAYLDVLEDQHNPTPPSICHSLVLFHPFILATIP